MSHPGCVDKKQAHYLQNIEEWRIFDAVQPAFASSNLGWGATEAHLSRTTDADRHAAALGSLQEDQRIDLLTAIDLFKVELESLPDSAPDRDIDCRPFEDCQNYLDQVLDILNGYVKESVIACIATPAPASTKDDVASLSDGSDKQIHVISDHKSPRNVPVGLTTTGSQLLKQVGNLLFPASWLKPVTSQSVDGPDPPKSDYMSPGSKYSKLVALGKLVGKALENGPENLHTACSIHLRLALDAEEFYTGLNVLRKFNTCFESPYISGVSKLKEPSYPLSLSATNWRDKTASEALSRLFNVICTRSSHTSCQAESTGKRHKAMLRLSGAQLDERPLAFSNFFLPCNSTDSWKSVSCKPKDKHDFIRRRYVNSLCSHISKHHSDPDTSAILPSIVFDSDELLENQSNVLDNSDARPATSFRRLLDDNVIRDRFEDGNRAALALSLACCLIHIPPVHTPDDLWRDRALTEDSILFLLRNSTSEILDVHHPYVCYSICQKKHDQKTGKTEHERYRFTLMSLALLLLEIHIGRSIDVDLTPCSDLDDAKGKLIKLLENAEGQKDAPTHYLSAIRGCLNFKASLETQRKRRPRDDLNDLIRRVIYDNIINHLEKNLSVIPKPSKFLAPRSLRLDALAYQRTYIDADMSTNSQFSASFVHCRSTTQLPQKRLQLSTSALMCGSSVSSPVDDLIMMFDGKLVDAKHVHVSEANRFLGSLETFYTNYVKAKAEARRKAEKKRIRIAVLDTGIREDDPYIRPVLDEIRGDRENLYKAQRRAALDARDGKITIPRRPSKPADFSPIRMKKRFPLKADGVPGGVAGDTLDSCGHGTHMAGLLLKVAPEANIYVAKIAENVDFDDVNPVVEAIKWAVEEPQSVDIISMSFGMEGRHGLLADAILAAARKVMFAAASNGGRNRPRAYPASDRNVICVHALSGEGASGTINPSTKNEHDRLGTLGMGLSLSWNGEPQFKDGTSYATPIAAAMAANWLEWLHAVAEENKTSLTKRELENWTCSDGIENIFSKVMSVDAAGDSELRYVAPWHLWSKNLSDDQIIGNIRRLVR